MFDPGQFYRWEADQRNTILLVESDLDPLYGKWAVQESPQKKSRYVEDVDKRLSFSSNFGDLLLSWSHDGTLLSWKAQKGPLVLKAELRSTPDMPDFGEIDSLSIEGDVQEQDL